jgi:hypothetical protein
VYNLSRLNRVATGLSYVPQGQRVCGRPGFYMTVSLRCSLVTEERRPRLIEAGLRIEGTDLHARAALYDTPGTSPALP